ncbi:MAG: DNA repair protein RecN [Clostridiales bacterium]|nr:DNA repair protein RecN [Clostridiales bacterium]
MLLELNITNIALIEKLRVAFAPGLNVLTGETGAGKSIVVDAMGLSLGGRADRELIRAGADRASVQAVFDVRGEARVEEALAQLGLVAEDGYLAIGRELTPSGRNLCRVAGEVVPLNALKQIAGLLVELNGQHESQELRSAGQHLGILDGYGGEGHARLLAGAQDAWARYAQARRELDALKRDLGERERAMGILAFQLDEIDKVRAKKGEDDKLERQFQLMGSAEKIATGLTRAYHLVYEGGERSPSAQEALKRAAAALQPIAGLDERFEALRSRLEELYYAAQDAGYELQGLKEDAAFDPAAFDKVGGRLDALDKLKRKYGPTLDDVLRFRDEAAAQLDALKRGDERLGELTAHCAALRDAYLAAAGALGDGRRSLAGALSEGVVAQLRELGMPRARFEVRFDGGAADEGRWGPRGYDGAEFMVSLNPGEPMKPLSATASGGELSRMMLAIKVLLADRDQVGSMIFDEIDAGISGRMAQVVGEKMALIGQSRQVIAVSHLPQIAALADAHFLVEKITDGERTGSSVRRLDDEGRIVEIGRMVGGAGDRESGLRHAEHMLAAGRAWKDGRSAQASGAAAAAPDAWAEPWG